MKFGSKEGFRLAAAVLMVIVGSSTVFALEGDGKDKKDGTSAETAKKIDKSAKGKDGSVKDKDTRDLREASEGVDNATTRGGAVNADFFKGTSLSFDPQISVIKGYLDSAAVNAKGNADFSQLIAEARSSYKSINENRSKNTAEDKERMDAIAFLARLHMRGGKGSAFYSQQGMETFASFAHGMSIRSVKPGVDADAMQIRKLRDLKSKMTAKDIEATKSSWETADAKTIVQAIAKVEVALESKFNMADPGKVNSADDVAAAAKAVENVKEIMKNFGDKMSTGEYKTINLALFEATVEWAIKNQKDVPTAVRCMFDPTAP